MATAATAPWVLRFGGMAEAGPEEDRIVAAAKKLGPVSLNGMMWALYWRNYPRLNGEFKDLTGISMDQVNDVPNLLIPQRAMAEAISRSGKFDIFHIETMMIPSLVAAGMLEPLDGYMKEAGFKLEMVGNFASFMKYQGVTYALPTDGNVCPQFIRKDLFENPDEQKRFADKHGKPLKWPVTWEDELEMMKFFHRPDKDLYGFGGLRDKENSSFWYWMYLYSAGGFPFSDDAEPTLTTPAAEYAVETFLARKDVSHPEAAAWGSPQMIPRIVEGKIFSAQYWDGIMARIEGSPTPTTGKWLYGVPPGSRFSGRLIHRSFSAPVMGLIVNKLSTRKKQAAMWALYMTTTKNSTEVVAHPTFTFHDPWHPAHMTAPEVEKVYGGKAGMKAIRQSIEVTAPPPYVTGYQEFKEAVDKNLSEAYAGRKSGKQALKDSQEEWGKIIKKIGKAKIKKEIPYYKATMPTLDVPS
ncbi:MAG: extracellular solute-binding protein [Nitrospinota bacterium]